MSERMKRDRMIEKMCKMANELMKDYSWEKECKIWDLCYDWNSNHCDCEIFMSEVSDDNDEVNGFAIEDDVWYF